MDSEIEKIWLEEVERFISHWEQEAESIKLQSLAPDECGKISDNFHKKSNGLLVRRPVALPDGDILKRIENLDNKLNSTLAMACKAPE